MRLKNGPNSFSSNKMMSVAVSGVTVKFNLTKTGRMSLI